MPPNFLHRTTSGSSTHRFNHFIHSISRSSSPDSKAPLISAAKPIEEETLPKYNPSNFYPARLGEKLNDKYEIVAKLGYGMTATVWLARDLSASGQKNRRKYVAIKINVNTLSTDFLQGRREISKKLLMTDPDHPGYTHVRFMIESFTIKARTSITSNPLGGSSDHLCLAYDVLREPINEVMERFPGHLFSSDKLRKLLPALLKGLDYMHDKCHVVHTDLKPDNIMMGLGDDPNAVLDRFVAYNTDHPCARKPPDPHDGRIIYQSCSDLLLSGVSHLPSNTELSEQQKIDAANNANITGSVLGSAKITDIGLAEWGDRGPQYKPIQSNAFTAPEVLLGLGWSYPADIWNLGAMLWDLIETCGLFDTIDTRPGHYHADQHLALMIALLGPPPKELLDRGLKTQNFFDCNKETGEYTFKNEKFLKKHLGHFSFEGAVTRMQGENKESFIDMMKKMIAWDTVVRWTAAQLLDHPWLKAKPTGGPICVENTKIGGGGTNRSQYSTPVGSARTSTLPPSAPGTPDPSRERQDSGPGLVRVTSDEQIRISQKLREKDCEMEHHHRFLEAELVPTPGSISKASTATDISLNMHDVKASLPASGVTSRTSTVDSVNGKRD